MKKITCLLLLISLSNISFGQDIHWSQFNDNPIFQNPGNTGQFNGDNLPDCTYFYQLKLNDTTHVGATSDPSQGRVGDVYTGFIVLQR